MNTEKLQQVRTGWVELSIRELIFAIVFVIVVLGLSQIILPMIPGSMEFARKLWEYFMCDVMRITTPTVPTP